MAVIEHDIVAQVYAAKAASEAADALIRQYMGFIRSEAMKTTKKSYGENEDEISIAMFAFYEAVMNYEKGRGAFLPYAARAIRSRLISQRIVRAERAKNEYEEERRTEEYQLFTARDFLTGYRLEDFYIGRMRQSFSRFLKGTGRELYAKEAVDQVMN